MPTPTNTTQPNYDRDAIYQPTSPLSPGFMHEALRTMFRALPLDPAEPKPARDRRLHAALLALSALHPRDEIEVMLGVQAMAAYHAAAAAFRIGMNHHTPNGDSTRHIAAACSAARTFDTLLKALERRQAKPLTVPPGRPEPKAWDSPPNPSAIIDTLAATIRADAPPTPAPEAVWTAEALVAADAFLNADRIEQENHGLDIANTEGILPGGGMIMMADPTPQQAAYIGRRLALDLRRQYEENLRAGINKYPKIRAIRPGDLIP